MTVYIAQRHNILTQYITMQTITDLCLEVEAHSRSRVEKMVVVTVGDGPSVITGGRRVVKDRRCV